MALFIISGASGSGKTSLIQELLARDENTCVSISHTTRVPRENEINGVDYHFCTLDKFNQLMKNKQFLENAKVFGNYYGTSKDNVLSQLNIYTNVILEIDWQGAKQVRENFANTISIQIIPPSLVELKNRLNTRAKDDKNIIAKRMQKAYTEISHYKEYDYIVINKDFDTALLNLKAIINSQQLTLNAKKYTVERILNTKLQF